MTVVAKNLKDEKRANQALVDECKKLLTPQVPKHLLERSAAARSRSRSRKAA